MLKIFYYFIISVDRQNPDLDGGVSGGDGNEIDLDKTNGESGTGKPISSIETNPNPSGNEVFIMDNRNEDRTASFFAQPGILAGKYFYPLSLIKHSECNKFIMIKNLLQMKNFFQGDKKIIQSLGKFPKLKVNPLPRVFSKVIGFEKTFSKHIRSN